MTVLSGTSLTWRGLTIEGTRASRHWLSSLDGWEDLPPTRRSTQARQGHGTFGGSVYSDERVITITGSNSTPAERDALLRELQTVMTLSGSSGTEPLTIEHAGRTLTADAQLTRFKPSMASWSSGRVPWAAEWVCPDPLRYGDPLASSTAFPDLIGGLEYDLYTDGAGTDLGYLDYGVASTTGRFTLSNAGTADSWPQFEIVGPVDVSGFEIATVGTGARLVFEGEVPAGSSLVLDSATGAVLIDGYADRANLLTWRDWAPVPAGGSTEYAFIPRGTRTAASVTGTVRPAFW